MRHPEKHICHITYMGLPLEVYGIYTAGNGPVCHENAINPPEPSEFEIIVADGIPCVDLIVNGQKYPAQEFLDSIGNHFKRNKILINDGVNPIDGWTYVEIDPHAEISELCINEIEG